MYFERLEIENYGPLKDLDINFPFSDAGIPKPLIIVGKNGSGKSILLSHVVNALMAAKEQFYPNTEVEDGKVYKLRSPHYVTSGKDYAFMKLHLSNGGEFFEWVLPCFKEDFENFHQYTPARKEWTQIPQGKNSVMGNNFDQKPKELKKLVDSNCSLYFPPNRFEEPSWLNESNLLSKPEHTDKSKILGESNRNIICHSPLKLNMNWLFDLLLDRELYERQIVNVPLLIQSGTTTEIPSFQGYKGASHTVYEEAIKLLRVILKDENVRFGVGNRQSRMMSIMRGQNTVVPHIFQLSTGETALLNIFLSILRDFDIGNGLLTKLENITGVVIIDEIDAHLHTQLQYEVLPQLISLFPKVQFIITTHSPLFLLGMEKSLGNDKFEILELPSGESVDAEMFSEFEEAYKTFSQSEKFQKDLKNKIENAQSPSIVLEGTTDIKYLQKAAELLGKKDLLKNVLLIDGGGEPHMKMFWKSNNALNGQLLTNKIILLYDCDVGIKDKEMGCMYSRTISQIASNPIKKGVENLFSKKTINKAKEVKGDFIDIYHETKRTIRGIEQTTPESWEVNKDEKSNLCAWICENGTEEDFSGFKVVFQTLEEILTEDQ